MGTWLRYMLVLAWMGRCVDIEGLGLGEQFTFDKDLKFECPKPKENKAFVGRAWSDSEDGDEPQNYATCLMAVDSYEEQPKPSTSNNNIDLSELQKENEELVRLQDEALNFSKFKKSSIVLDDMLSRQKLSQDKEGFGFSKNGKTSS
ncbi:hypothetical protein Tco_1377016, partial [Tanacetum coccineum]